MRKRRFKTLLWHLKHLTLASKNEMRLWKDKNREDFCDGPPQFEKRAQNCAQPTHPASPLLTKLICTSDEVFFHAASNTFIPIRNWCDVDIYEKIVMWKWPQDCHRSPAAWLSHGCGRRQNRLHEEQCSQIVEIPHWGGFYAIPPLSPNQWRRTWSSLVWRNSMASSALGISTTSASKHFR